jgi:hypothetical protein
MLGSSLGSQMLSAHERQRSRAQLFMRGFVGDLDDFLYKVQKRFLDGVHNAYVDAVLPALSGELGTQQEMAEALGLKDRTSISQMKRSHSMDGVRLTAALHQYRELIEFPSRELAALYGFARATSYIKALAVGEASIEGTMSPQDFALLTGVLASLEWEEAVRHPELDRARRLAAQIYCERAIDAGGPQPKRRMRPEECVLLLQQLQLRWGDSAAVALWSIPDRIPVAKRGEVTL